MKVLELQSDENTNKALVLWNGQHYIVSESKAFGLETLIFPGDAAFKVVDWLEIGGAKGITLSEVLANFSNYIIK